MDDQKQAALFLLGLLAFCALAIFCAFVANSQDNDPNLCFEPGWSDRMPFDAQGFADLKRMCEQGSNSAWLTGWRCHPANDALAHCPLASVGSISGVAGDQSDRAPAATDLRCEFTNFGLPGVAWCWQGRGDNLTYSQQPGGIG